jgi:hypothetical protein
MILKNTISSALDYLGITTHREIRIDGVKKMVE